MFDWLHNLITASEQPILESYNIVDPSAVGDKIRSVTLALTPPINESPTSVVSLYWTDADAKIYEKQFEDLQTAHDLYDAMKHDLVEAAELTKLERVPEASALVSSLLKRYDIYTDSLVDGNPEPVTTTMASQENPLLPKEAEILTDIGTPEWTDKILGKLFQDYITAEYVPDHDDILFDLRNLAEDAGHEVSVNDIHSWLKEYDQWRRTSKTSSLTKQAKVTFQNIFFTTPDEAIEYQEKMKKMNPTDVQTSVPPKGMNEEAPLPEGEEDIGPPSLSYDDFEKNKADEQKLLTKRIEKEVKDQVESALEQKAAATFSKTDEALVKAMRDSGRKDGEISDYFVKTFKYPKEDVAVFLERTKNPNVPQKSENPLLKDEPLLDEKPIEEPKPEVPKPPAELVSPETHDKLVQDVNDEIERKEMMEIARLDGEISKKAEEPLETRPATPIGNSNDGANVSPADMSQDMLQNPNDPPELAENNETIPDQDLKSGDHVYVMGDYDSGIEGFAGTYKGQYKSEGETWAMVDIGNGSDWKEIPIRNVKKAFFVSVLNKIADRKKKKKVLWREELYAIKAELSEIEKEISKEAAPFEQPAPAQPQVVPAIPVEQPTEPAVKFKPMDRAPNKTKNQETVTPSVELASTLRELNDVTAKLNEMKAVLAEFNAKIEAERQSRIKQFQNVVQPEKSQAIQDELVKRVSTITKGMEDMVIESGEWVYRIIEEEKTISNKPSDKELLEKVRAKFADASKYIDSVINGAKSQDVTTKERVVYRSPKPKPVEKKQPKSMLALSRHDIHAGMLDTLSDMYDDMVAAFRSLMEADQMLETSISPQVGVE